MATRFTAEYTTVNTNDTIEVVIDDSSFAGTVKEIAGTGSDWFQDNLQQINVKEPLSTRIQNRQITVSLWVEEEQFITDLFTSQEERFKLIYDKNSSREWEGYILPDLCSYEQHEEELWRLTLVAKDFSVFKGVEFGSSIASDDDRVKIIESIAGILSEKYSIDIYTHTEWIVDGTTTTGDFLNQIYIDEFSLRDYARTADEDDELITFHDALDRILKACGCIIKQVSGRFYIQQLTGLDRPFTVNEFQYNSSGVLQTTTDVDLTNAVKPLRSSPNNHNYGIKSARLKYEHRSSVTDISFPSIVNLTDTEQTQTFSQFFVGTGDEQLELTGRVRAFSTTDTTDGRVELTIKSGTLYYDGSAWNTTATNRVTVDLTGGGLLIDGEYVYVGFINVTTAPIPLTNSGNIEVTLRNGIIENSPDIQADRTEYDGLDFDVIGATANENSLSIDYKLTQSGTQSVKIDYGKVYFGDGPGASSRGGFTEDLAGETGTNNNWASRGETTFIPHAQILLREFLDFQRRSRRRISATIRDSLEWIDVISYDGDYYYNLGGTFDGYTGDCSTESVELNIQTGSDTFEDLPKFLPDGVTSSASTSTGTSPTSGITQTDADARYLNESNNLSDLDSPSSARASLGLVIGTDVQAHSSALDDYSSNSLEAAELDQLQNINTVTVSNTQWGYLGALNQGLTTTSNPTFNDLSLTGALDSGSITSGFGNIDIGSSTLNAGNSTLTSLLIDHTSSIGLTVDGIDVGGTSGLRILSDRANESVIQFGDQDSVNVGQVIYDHSENKLHLYASGLTRTFIDSTGISIPRLGTETKGLYWDRSGITDSYIELRDDENLYIEVDNAGLSGRSIRFFNNSSEIVRLGESSNTIFESTIFENNITHNASIESDNFDLGTGSTGWIVDGADGFGAIDNSGKYHLYTDDLTVRGRLRVFELVVKQISAIGGTEILSVANAEADSVSGSAGSEVVTVTDPTGVNVSSLEADDLVVVAQFDINDPENLVKQEFRTVDSVSGLDVTLTSTSGAPAPSSAIEEGDFIVQYGNTSDSTRQSIIYRNVEGNPIVRLQSGINSYSDFNNPKSTTEFAYGDLDGLVEGITSTEFGVALGDMSLTNNHVLLTDTQASLKLDTFDLDTNTLSIKSSTNRINVNDAVIIDDTTTDTFEVRASDEITYFSQARTLGNEYSSAGEVFYEDITSLVDDNVFRFTELTYFIAAREELTFDQVAATRLVVEGYDGSSWEFITPYGYLVAQETITYDDYGGGDAQDALSQSYTFSITDSPTVKPNDIYSQYRLRVENFGFDTDHGVQNIKGEKLLHTTKANSANFVSRDIKVSNEITMQDGTDKDSNIKFVVRRRDSSGGTKRLGLYAQCTIDGVFQDEYLINEFTDP